MLFLDEDDVDFLSPTYIRIPLAYACPTEDMLRLLIFLEQYYTADCYLVLTELSSEDPDNIRFMAQGVTSDAVLLVTSWVDDSEVITGLITPFGELELAAFSEDFRQIYMLQMDDGLVRTLGLEYCDEAFRPHREYLESIGEYDADDCVYLPHALYV